MSRFTPRPRATALLCAVAIVVACTRSSARQGAVTDGAARPYVVVVSLDAFRFDYIER